MSRDSQYQSQLEDEYEMLFSSIKEMFYILRHRMQVFDGEPNYRNADEVRNYAACIQEDAQTFMDFLKEHE